MDEYKISDDLRRKIYLILEKYQEERHSGQWYITQTGLNKVAKLLGGRYTDLGKFERGVFRRECVDYIHSFRPVNNWYYYLNCDKL